MKSGNECTGWLFSLLEKSTFLNSSNSISGVRLSKDLESVIYSPGLFSFIKAKVIKILKC
jgi:hypothetical protein